MNRYVLFIIVLVGLQANIALSNPVRDFFNTAWRYFKPATAHAQETKTKCSEPVQSAPRWPEKTKEKSDSEQNNNLNVHSPELKTTFEVIQDIYGLAARVKKDAKKHDISMKLRKDVRSAEDRTKQGLYLTVETYPRSLQTPWGQLDIFDGASYSRSLQTPWGQVVIIDNGSYHDSHISDGSHLDMIFNEFRKNMKLKFVRNTCEKSSENRDKKAVQFYKENFQTPIFPEHLEKYRGTDTKIISSLCGCRSIYEIAKFGDIELPKAEQLGKQNFFDRKHEHVEKSWKEFMACYKNSSKQ